MTIERKKMKGGTFWKALRNSHLKKLKMMKTDLWEDWKRGKRGSGSDANSVAVHISRGRCLRVLAQCSRSGRRPARDPSKHVPRQSFALVVYDRGHVLRTALSGDGRGGYADRQPRAGDHRGGRMAHAFPRRSRMVGHCDGH